MNKFTEQKLFDFNRKYETRKEKRVYPSGEVDVFEVQRLYQRNLEDINDWIKQYTKDLILELSKELENKWSSYSDTRLHEAEEVLNKFKS